MQVYHLLVELIIILDIKCRIREEELCQSGQSIRILHKIYNTVDVPDVPDVAYDC